MHSFHSLTSASDVSSFTNSIDPEKVAHYQDLHYLLSSPELQIRGSIEDYSKIFSLFLNENICRDLIEPSQWDGSNNGLQNMF